VRIKSKAVRIVAGLLSISRVSWCVLRIPPGRTFHVLRNTQYAVSGLYLFLLITLLVASPSALAQEPISPTQVMLAANRAYEAGDYLRAAAGYEALISYGLRNADVYYNLGNAYFKHGDLGRAILNYRRAYRLDPRDPDILTNLTIARAQTLDRLESSEGTLTNLVQLAEEWLTLREAAFLALFLWLSLCGLALLTILLPRRRRLSVIAMAIVAIFLAVGLFSIANRYYSEQRYPPAVVVVPQVDVTSGPGGSDQYLVEFELHSGAEVRLVESRPGWQRLTLADNLQGWVPAEAIERVVQE
jgi:tetratricopeptide (TPR) repeat protein